MEINNKRITEYLTGLLREYIFTELSEDYLKRADIKDIMLDVPVPVDKDDLRGISVFKLAQNMTFVLGCDPDFKYKEKYLAYIMKNFDERFVSGLIKQGIASAEKEEYEKAAVGFRAAIVINPELSEAYYFYGRALKDCYEHSEDEKYIGVFKAEAIAAFETATVKNPGLAEAYYFLGYSYLNLGLYMKAKLTWDEYSGLTARLLTDNPPENEDVRKETERMYQEIQERLAQLEAPVMIEKGYNMILSGKYRDGINTLKPFRDGEYKEWWPLWYYLATAYTSLGLIAEGEAGKVDEVAAAAYEEAIKNHLEVLKLSPSNEDTMIELIELYTKLGNREKAVKYEKKLEVVQNNRFEDQKLKETE